MSDSPIGLIGVGLLGTALADRLLAAGLAVVGFDKAPACGERLSALGGRFAMALGDVAAECDQIVLCLPDSKVVSAVVEELGDRLAAGKLLIDATTGDPEETVGLAARLAACGGVAYVDATIAGSSEQVRRGEAVVMIGGDAGDVECATRALASWSDRRFHVGPTGSGARLKLVVNLVLGLNRAVLAEGLALARAVGINPSSALEVLKVTPAYSTVMDSKGAKMIAGDYAPQARLAQHLKDVGLIRELARKHSAVTPLSDVHETLLQQAVQLGFAEADNCAVIEAFKQ